MLSRFLSSSLGKKYIMAVTGLVLVLFVLGHMAGNLLVFIGPEAINAYAYKLKNLPLNLLWVIRIFLLACVAGHIWMAIALTRANRAARPDRYRAQASIQASYASRTMPMSGLIILSFIIFHILHYTTQSIYDYSHLYYQSGSKEYFNVYNMVIEGFSVWYVSLFYIIAMALLCVHLSHGVSSMFQSVGLRSEKWRSFLDKIARAYGLIIFLGFISIPVAVIAGWVTSWDPPVQATEALQPAQSISPVE